MEHFCKSVIGSSHKDSKLPCQDSSLSEEFDKGCIIAVSDGHGSRTYVRSHIGSNLACSIAVKLAKEFVLDNYDILSKIERKSFTPDSGVKADTLFLNLFTRIHEQWYEAIKENVANMPFTDQEKMKLGNADIKEAFGCTLMVAVKTDCFTFAFHIGDGRIYTISYNNEWMQPVPWDSACEDNITTSLCENNPVDSFRYYVDSSDNQPFIIFACSDGIEDCYGGSHDGKFQSEKLIVDYSEVIRAYLQDKESDFDVDCKGFLNNQSTRLSHDDMSIAFVIDDRFQLQQTWLKLIDYQRSIFEVAEEYKSHEVQIDQLSDRLKIIGTNIIKCKKELRGTEESLELKKKERDIKKDKLLSEKSCKDTATTFNAKIIQFKQDIKNYCDLYENETIEVSLNSTNEYITFKKKLTGYILKAIKKALEVIRADIKAKQENTVILQSEIDTLNDEIQKLSEKKESQKNSLRIEEEKLSLIEEQKKSLTKERDECGKKKKEVEEKTGRDIQLIYDEIKNKMPHEEVENCSGLNEEVYNTLNICKRYSGKDEDFNITIESNNSIVLTYSEDPNLYYISKDVFEKLLEIIKGANPKVFSADENLYNNCITVLFYKKDGTSTIRTIDIEEEQAQIIWDACTNILNNNGVQ